MPTCSACGLVGAPDDRFCRRCGAPLPPPGLRPPPQAAPEDPTTVLPRYDYPPVTAYQPTTAPQPTPRGPAPRPPRQPRHAPDRSAAPLIVAGLVVLLLIILGAYFSITHLRGGSTASTSSTRPTTEAATTTAPSTTPPASRTPSATPKATPVPPAEIVAATKVKALLDKSTAARSGVQKAISSISNCKDVQASVDALDTAAGVRNGLITQLGALDVSPIPTGARLAASLKSALQESAAADSDYASWGRTALRRCKGHAVTTGSLTTAHQHDSRATAAKSDFAALWNPVARKVGLPTVSAGRI